MLATLSVLSHLGQHGADWMEQEVDPSIEQTHRFNLISDVVLISIKT